MRDGVPFETLVSTNPAAPSGQHSQPPIGKSLRYRNTRSHPDSVHFALDERAQRRWGAAQRSSHEMAGAQRALGSRVNKFAHGAFFEKNPSKNATCKVPMAAWRSHVFAGMPSRNGSSPPADRRAVIAAKSIHRELRLGGFTDEEVLRLASELLTLVTDDVRSRRVAG